MAFPVNSTAVETDAIKRVIRVLQRARVRKLIAYAGVFVCKRISGSNTWSQHSWGNAADLFPKPVDEGTDARLRTIANAVVYQATHKTVANRGRKIPAAEVIDHNNRRIWTPGEGWRPYSGTLGAHVHVSGKPLRTGTPPCAA